jgi:hypothetical protein
MTKISEMELIERMRKRLIETRDGHNQLVKSLNKSRILRNLQEYSDIEKSTITVNNSIKELSNKLHTIVRTSKIEIISADKVDVDEIFDLYYKQAPPFSRSEKKKYEFPDAFIVKTIESWCKSNKKKIIFLSKDADFSDYKSRRIIFKQSLPETLEKITAYYDSLQQHQYIPHIQTSLKNNKEELLEQIEVALKKLIMIDIDFEKINNFERTHAEFNNYNITSIRPEYAEISYYIKTNIKYTILPDPLDMNRTIFEENIRPKIISESILIPCDLEIYFSHRNNIKIKWINSNQRIIVRQE